MPSPSAPLDPVAAARREAGRELANRRVAAVLSQEQLARRVGYSRSQVAGAEKGHQRTAEGFWVRCGDVLGASDALIAAYRKIEDVRQVHRDEVARQAEVEREVKLRRWQAERGIAASAEATVAASAAAPISDTFSLAPLSWSTVQRSAFLRHLATVILAATASPILETLDPDAAERISRAIERTSRIDRATVDDMRQVTAAYRRGYRQLSAHSLLPQTVGHLELVTELLRGSQASSANQALIAVIGETAMIAGTLSLHDLYDFEAARAYYRVSKIAVEEAEHRELTAYLLGCMSFLAAYSGNRHEAVGLAQRSEELAARCASPKTQAWLHAVSAEVHATAHDPKVCLFALDAAAAALDRADDDPPWIGIGGFDHAKLDGYRGLCYLRLDQHKAAHAALLAAMEQLRPSFVKHRCTALADLAAALLGMGEVDEACEHASQALAIATTIKHATSIRRVRNLRNHMHQWNDTAAVQQLDEQLLLAS